MMAGKAHHDSHACLPLVPQELGNKHATNYDIRKLNVQFATLPLQRASGLRSPFLSVRSSVLKRSAFLGRNRMTRCDYAAGRCA
jgi:hypothetical protein